MCGASGGGGFGGGQMVVMAVLLVLRCAVAVPSQAHTAGAERLAVSRVIGGLCTTMARRSPVRHGLACITPSASLLLVTILGTSCLLSQSWSGVPCYLKPIHIYPSNSISAPSASPSSPCPGTCLASSSRTSRMLLAQTRPGSAPRP